MKENNRLTRPRFRGSVFFPLILIAVGIVFLLNNAKVLTGDAWDIIFSLWPIILIAIGIDSLIRRHGLAGPVFWIGIGVIILLSNYGLIHWNVWDLILRLWPILLIAIGLDIAIGRRSIWGALVALVLVLAILAGVVGLAGTNTTTITKEVSWTPQTVIDRINAVLDIPIAGSLTVNSVKSGDAAIKGTLQLQRSETVNEQYSIESDKTGVILLRGEGIERNYTTWNFGGSTWDIGFNPKVPLNLSVQMGVGEINLDLRDFNLSALDAQLGVGKITISLPSRKAFSADIKNPIGQTIVNVPKNTGIRITSDTGLATIQVPPDFERQDNTYTSPGYDKAEIKIDLNLSQPIGLIQVRYIK